MVKYYWVSEDMRSVWEVVVWNWKTGELVRFCDLGGRTLLNLPQVLDLSSADNEFLNEGTGAIFLDEFRVAVILETLAAGLAVFNTLVAQDHPGYFQQLVFPLELHHMYVDIFVDHDRDLGKPNQDEVLLHDPAQVVLVAHIWAFGEPRILLVVRTQDLVEQVDSVRTDCRVPWDEWGRNVVAIQFPNDDGHELTTFVHGAQVMVVCGPGGCDVRTFDFGQRGRGFLPLRGGADGTGRSILFEDGTHFRFEPGLGFDPLDQLESLSDGSLIHLVSCLAHYVGSEVVG